MGTCLDVRIDSLDSAGRGLNADGTIAVQAALPGELVHVEIVHRANHGPHPARVLDVKEASPERIEPVCDKFLDCGGCDFLHASLPAQHAFKEGLVAEALNREVLSVLPSPRTRGYRATAKLVVGPGRMLGSYRPRSHYVVDMQGCEVHAHEVEAVADHIRAVVKEPPHLDLRYVVLRGDVPDGLVAVTLISKSANAIGIAQLTERIFEHPRVGEVVFHANNSTGDALFGDGPHKVMQRRQEVFQNLGPIRQRLRSGAFSQNNPQAATLLYAEVAKHVGKAKHVLDVFGGSGGIALTLLQGEVEQATLIERHDEAVTAAQEGAADLGVQDRFHGVTADATRWLKESNALFDAVIVNPPRKGAGQAMLKALAPIAPKLVYVSCNPVTLARDLKDSDWEIEGVQPVDMFPQTRHVETVLWARSLAMPAGLE